MNTELQKEKLHNYKNREKKLQIYNMEHSYNWDTLFGPNYTNIKTTQSMIKQSNYHFPSVYKYTVKGYLDTMHSAEWQNEHEHLITQY